MPAVYFADSLALAALELFVHLSEEEVDTLFFAFRVTVPNGVTIESLDRRRLPRKWRTDPEWARTQKLGREWFDRGKSALLRVPSAVVPQEHNLVLNPTHRDFDRIIIGRAEAFSYDPRMWK